MIATAIRIACDRGTMSWRFWLLCLGLHLKALLLVCTGDLMLTVERSEERGYFGWRVAPVCYIACSSFGPQETLDRSWTLLSSPKHQHASSSKKREAWARSWLALFTWNHRMIVAYGLLWCKCLTCLMRQSLGFQNLGLSLTVLTSCLPMAIGLQSLRQRSLSWSQQSKHQSPGRWWTETSREEGMAVSWPNSTASQADPSQQRSMHVGL